MTARLVVLLSALAVALLSFTQEREADSKQDQHTEVSMRLIGHQTLLSLGDSSSRVLPVEKTGDKYRIRFATEFEFNPETVAKTIDSVIQVTNIATSYIVAFESCETQQIVHSYEVGKNEESNVLACGTRNQPKACYNLLITILDGSIEPVYVESSANEISANEDYTEIYKLLVLLVAAVIVLMGIVVLILKRKSGIVVNPNVINIGQYQFNKRGMELILGNERIELTSKECDLLQLLCDSTNDTVERETILRMVWGDDGDYVGRTLDVFISKLRKKLEADSKVKIANIRGVGYRLIVDT